MAYLYGLLSQQDLYEKRVTEIGVDEVVASIQQTIDEHNKQLDALFSLFVKRTTQFQLRFRTSTAARLQPLDDNGRARPIQPSGQYDVAFPLHAAGTAWGADYRTGIKMTVGDAADATKTLIDADLRWMRDHLLAAMFVNGSWTFTDPMHGDLSVYGPASGDSTIYQVMAGADQMATDDHILGSAALDAAVFSTIKDELTEHPENAGDIIVLIPTASRSTVEGLTGFYPIADPNLRVGANTTELIGRLGASVPGQLFGYIDSCWCVEWRSFPSNYVVGVSTGGDPPLAMREEPEKELQGFNEVAERNDHPFYERQYLRIAGFGAWNRVGMVTMRTNSATYAVPTGYGSPMG